MKAMLNVFIAGVLFGIGLAVSGMTDPARIADFLDITGEWDITLMFVMGGALLVMLPGFVLVTRREQPWFGEKFYIPSKNDLDWKLIVGSILFGIGWGISGFCPGPAIASLVSANQQVFNFVLAMILGQNLMRWIERKPG